MHLKATTLVSSPTVRRAPANHTRWWDRTRIEGSSLVSVKRCSIESMRWLKMISTDKRPRRTKSKIRRNRSTKFSRWNSPRPIASRCRISRFTMKKFEIYWIQRSKNDGREKRMFNGVICLVITKHWKYVRIKSLDLTSMDYHNWWWHPIRYDSKDKKADKKTNGYLIWPNWFRKLKLFSSKEIIFEQSPPRIWITKVPDPMPFLPWNWLKLYRPMLPRYFRLCSKRLKKLLVRP